MEINVKFLSDLVQVISASGDAILKLIEGFKTMVITGNHAYDYISAKRERDRLLDISRRTTNLIVAQRIDIVETLDEYLKRENPTQDSWTEVVENIKSTLVGVKELLTHVQAENGDLVLQPAFLTLNETLSVRQFLLRGLVGMRAPSTTEERELLRQASAKYKILIANAEQAVLALNAYINKT